MQHISKSIRLILLILMMDSMAGVTAVKAKGKKKFCLVIKHMTAELTWIINPSYHEQFNVKV